MSMPYPLLADAVLIAHVGVIVFVIGGLVAVMLGNRRHWHWVNAGAFRLTHLAAVVFIAVQALLGRACPLTVLESWLRVKTGAPGYPGSFIEYWLHRLIYYEAPAWVFAMTYLAFTLLVVAAWWRYPPDLPAWRRRPVSQLEQEDLR
jgi:hypothetical protein